MITRKGIDIELAAIDEDLGEGIDLGLDELKRSAAKIDDRIHVAEALGKAASLERLRALSKIVDLQIDAVTRLMADLEARSPKQADLAGKDRAGSKSGQLAETLPSQPQAMTPTSKPPAPSRPVEKSTIDPDPLPPSRTTRPPQRAEEQVAEPHQVTPKAPRSKVTRSAFIKMQQALSTKERELLVHAEWTKLREASFKAAICEARKLMEIARDLSKETNIEQGPVMQTYRELKKEWNRNHGSPFLALNDKRTQNGQTWSDLTDAFWALATAVECMEWLQTNPPLEAEKRKRLIEECGAAEAWIHRLEEQKGLSFTDSTQMDVHRAVEALAKAEDLFVPWWMLSGERHRPTEEVAAAARSLRATYENERSSIQGRLKRERALDALKKLADSIEEDGAPENTILPAIIECIDAGIPPSNKDLTVRCLPYRALLQESGNPRFAKLVDYLKQRETLALKNRIVERDQPADDTDPNVEAARARLHGKTVLFVGGLAQQKKRAAYESAFHLKELIWPDSEPDTQIDSFGPAMEKADLVCLLIRWSRHSYKAVIDRAKAQGKMTMTVKAGLGINRFAHDVLLQLPEPS